MTGRFGHFEVNCNSVQTCGISSSSRHRRESKRKTSEEVQFGKLWRFSNVEKMVQLTHWFRLFHSFHSIVSIFANRLSFVALIILIAPNNRYVSLSLSLSLSLYVCVCVCVGACVRMQIKKAAE